MQVSTPRPSSLPSLPQAAALRSAPLTGRTRAAQEARAPGQARPREARPALVLTPLAALHGLWHVPMKIVSAVAAVWRLVADTLMGLARAVAARLGLGTPFAVPLEPAPAQDLAAAADTGPALRPAPKPRPASAPALSLQRPMPVPSATLAHWCRVLDVFRLKLVLLRPAAGKEPPGHWMSEQRSAHHLWRSAGLVNFHMDAEGQPRLLFNTTDLAQAYNTIRGPAPHVVVECGSPARLRGHRPLPSSAGAASGTPLAAFRPAHILRLEPRTFAAHLRVVAAVAALPDWPQTRPKAPMRQKLRRLIRRFGAELKPAPVPRANTISEEHTPFRDWGDDERLFIAAADTSNFFGAQAILDVVLRRQPCRHLRAQEALLGRYGIEAAEAHNMSDAELVQKMLTVLVASMRQTCRENHKHLATKFGRQTTALPSQGGLFPPRAVRSWSTYR